MKIKQNETELVIDENGRPKGYLTTTEYAQKNFVGDAAVRVAIYRGRITPLRIGNRTFIAEDTPYPERRRPGRKRLEEKG